MGPRVLGATGRGARGRRRAPTAAAWAIGLALLVVLGAGAARPSLAASITVLTFDESRVGPKSPQFNPNFLTGNAFSAARASLLDPARFGPGGTVPRSVAFASPVPTITSAALQGIDVVVLPLSGTTISAAERAALDDFVQRGGGLMVFDNDAANAFASIFPGASAGGSSSTGTGWVSNASSPLVNGPFGALALNTSFGTGFAKSFSQLGSEGHEALRNSAGVLGAGFEHAAGRAALFTDEEIFINNGQAGFAGARWSSTTQTIFLNSFAWVTPPEGWNVVPVPEPASVGLFLGGLALLVSVSVGATKGN